MQAMDEAILQFFLQLHTGFGDFLMPLVSFLGNGGLIWICIAVGLLCFGKTRRYGVMVAVALLLGLLIGNLILKPLVARPRPCHLHPQVELLIPVPQDYSFPSGHTLSGFAAAGVLFSMRRRVGVAAFILAGLIALSRMYLYVHYPSDIAAGVLLGLCCAFAAIRLTGWLERWWQQRTTR